MNARQFLFSAPVAVLFGLSSVLLSSCGGGRTPAPDSPFAGTYKGSIVYAIGATNISLTFDTAQVDSSGQFACDTTYGAFSGNKPITVQNKVRGTVAADGSTVLTLTPSTPNMSGKLSLSGNKLTGAVAEPGTNNTVTVRLLLDLTRQ